MNNTNKKRSIVKSLLVPVLATVCIGATLLSATNYMMTRQSTEDILRNQAISMSKTSNDSLNLFLEELEENITTNANLPDIKNGLVNKQMTANTLKIIKDNYTPVESIYLATLDGQMNMYPNAELPAGYNPIERDWYKNTLANPDKAVWVEPYTDLVTGVTSVTVSKVVKDTQGKVIGALAYDITLNKIKDLLSDHKIGKNGYVFIMDKSGVAIMHPDKQKQGKDLSKEEFFKKLLSSKENEGNFQYTIDGIEKELVHVKNDKLNVFVAGSVNASEFTDAAREQLIPTIIVLIVILLLVGSVIYHYLRKMANRIQTVTTSLKSVSEGDYEITIPVRDSKHEDEIDELAVGFNKMIVQTKNMLETIEETSVKLESAVSAFVTGIDENSKAINATANTMEQIANGAGDQAVMVERTANDMDELSKHMGIVETQSGEIKEGTVVMEKAAKQGETKIDYLRIQSEETTRLTKQSVEAIHSLDASSKNINDIILTISEIADQTNLLALNAAIEAARAGESGRGFAVVADEVRKLAEKSAVSTKEITNLIQKMQVDTTKAVDLIIKTHDIIEQQGESVTGAESSFKTISDTIISSGKKVQDIVNSIESMTTKKEAVVLATKEISSITQELAAGTEEVSASAEEQGASMQQLETMAHTLNELALKLSNEITGMKKK